jgi:acyl-CoA reductase-like NAD-dependent aldehyde dehydrogenase
MGPVISRKQLEKIDFFVKKALDEGAKILTGGRRAGDLGFFYEPTLIGNCTPFMTPVKEEIFGPVICILPFETEEDSLRLANDTPYGLAASVWTSSMGRAYRMQKNLDVGITWVNGHHHNDPSSIWGGMKDSGIGVENGVESYNSYTQLKSMVINYGKFTDWFGNGKNVRYG